MLLVTGGVHQGRSHIVLQVLLRWFFLKDFDFFPPEAWGDENNFDSC